MTALRTSIENGIQTALTPLLLKDLGGAADSSGYLHALGPYAGEIPGADISDEFRERLAGRLPAVMYYTGDGQYEPIDIKRRRATNTIEIHILITSGTLRVPKARTQGGIHAGDQDPGIYQIIEDVREKLFGSDLSVTGSGRLVPTTERLRVFHEDLTLWEMVFVVETDAFQAAEDATADEYETMAGDINMPTDPEIDPVVELTSDLT